MSKRFFWKPSLAAVALVFAAGCTSGTSSDDELDPTANPTDYPAVPASESCGGKCDDPNALLNAYSEQRLLSGLEITARVNEDGETEYLEFAGSPLDEHVESLDDGHTLSMAIRAADGASTDFAVESELVYDGDTGEFVSDIVETSELLPWQLLSIEVTGTQGEREIAQIFEFGLDGDVGAEYIPEPTDPWADAKNVDLGVIQLDPDLEAPDYERASVDNFNLGGTEFWQRWPGGENPTFSYSVGSDFGRKCMYASARRFDAIMGDPPPAMVELKESSNWSGRFFNWNDDFSDESATRRPSGAVLWAWRTGLIKWISQTSKEGACFLPTYDMVERAANNCLATAERDDGEIEGCQAN